VRPDRGPRLPVLRQPPGRKLSGLQAHVTPQLN
jgi:hypothetical protein